MSPLLGHSNRAAFVPSAQVPAALFLFTPSGIKHSSLALRPKIIRPRITFSIGTLWFLQTFVNTFKGYLQMELNSDPWGASPRFDHRGPNNGKRVQLFVSRHS